MPAARLLTAALAFALACSETQSPWLEGERLESTAELDDILGERLPRAIVALDSAKDIDPLAPLAHCPNEHAQLCLLLRRLVAAAHWATVVPEGWLDYAVAVTDWQASRVNRLLATEHRAYYIDVAIIELEERRLALAFSFRINELRRYRVAKDAVAVLLLERLDTLNWEHQVVGFADEREEEVTVLTSSIAAEAQARRNQENADAARLWRNAAPELEILYERVIAHELQHRVDSRGTLGIVDSRFARRFAEPEAAAELSSYIAEIAHSPRSALLSIAWLTSLCSERHAAPENAIAAAILEDIAEAMSIAGAPCHAESWLHLDAEKHGQPLADAAATLWQRVFGQPLALSEASRAPLRREHKAHRDANKTRPRTSDSGDPSHQLGNE